MKCRNAKLFGVVREDDSDRIYIAVAIHDGREQTDSLSVRFPLLATSAQGTKCEFAEGEAAVHWGH